MSTIKNPLMEKAFTIETRKRRRGRPMPGTLVQQLDVALAFFDGTITSTQAAAVLNIGAANRMYSYGPYILAKAYKAGLLQRKGAKK